MKSKIITKDDINYPDVVEIVKCIIGVAGSEYGLSESGIHKIAFVLKKKLNEDNKLKESLPFYWYYYGPFSEVIKEAIGIASQNEIIKERP